MEWGEDKERENKGESEEKKLHEYKYLLVVGRFDHVKTEVSLCSYFTVWSAPQIEYLPIRGQCEERTDNQCTEMSAFISHIQDRRKMSDANKMVMRDSGTEPLQTCPTGSTAVLRCQDLESTEDRERGGLNVIVHLHWFRLVSHCNQARCLCYLSKVHENSRKSIYCN